MLQKRALRLLPLFTIILIKMNRVLPILPMILFLLMVVMAACGEKDAMVEGEIIFETPTAGAVVADPNQVNLQVRVTTSGDELHDLEITLTPQENPDDLILEFDGHEHEADYVFMESRNLSGYPAGTVFQLAVEACLDHDCETLIEDAITFSIP
jgi:hypothetical protein